jgi:hypothetical protein
MGWDGMGWDGMGWDGMGWDGMGWDGMGWHRYQYVFVITYRYPDSGIAGILQAFGFYENKAHCSCWKICDCFPRCPMEYRMYLQFLVFDGSFISLRIHIVTPKAPVYVTLNPQVS